jgi:hypothetical protein
MQFLLFLSIALGALFIVASVFQVALEIKRVRILLETQFLLEPVTGASELRYKKARDKFEDV